MNYKIIEVEGIGEVYAKKLTGIGINTIEDLLEKAGPELDREQAAGKLHLAAGRETDGVLEDLHVRHAAADADDLAHEARLSEERVADFVEGDGAVERDGDEVAVDAGDGSCGHGRFSGELTTNS